MSNTSIQVVVVVFPYQENKKIMENAQTQLRNLANLFDDGYELIASSTIQADNTYANVYTMKKSWE